MLSKSYINNIIYMVYNTVYNVLYIYAPSSVGSQAARNSSQTRSQLY